MIRQLNPNAGGEKKMFFIRSGLSMNEKYKWNTVMMY